MIRPARDLAAAPTVYEVALAEFLQRRLLLWVALDAALEGRDTYPVGTMGRQHFADKARRLVDVLKGTP